jgi:lactobin A/cerein 7B family class IIb bacteriocin
MKELSIEDVSNVSGGDMPTAVAYGTGLATSVAIGAALGPAGIAASFTVYTASFFGTYYWQRYNRA